MTERLRTAIKFTINELTALLQTTPEKLLQDIDRGAFTDLDDYLESTSSCIRDTNYIVESLQETLNLVLDARKRLIQLGLYNLGTTNEEGKGRRSEVQIGTRNTIPYSLEENEDSNNNTTYVPPD